MAIIHHWDLQETSGTTVTDAVSANHGTIDGSVTLGATGPGGSLTKAADFDGTAQRPITLDTDIVLKANEDWSVAFWATTNAADYKGMVAGGDGPVTSRIWLEPQIGKIQVFGIDNSGPNITSENSVGVLRFHTITHVGSTESTEIFVDNVSQGNGTLNSDLILNTLGNGYANSSFALNGTLADFRIYDSILTSEEKNSLFALGSNGITIDNIANEQFYQRPVSGDLSITVSGTSVSDEAIEYQVDAGAWQTLALSASGIYSGTVNVSAGNHTLGVRLSSDTNVNNTVAIHVGDAFGWFGQNNPDGRFAISQPYTGSLGFWIYDQDDVWIAGTSGYKSPATTLFSVLPRLASLIEATTGVPVAFICETKGGTGVTVGPWDSNPAGAQYLAAVAAINDSGINGLLAALFDAGENDAIDAGVTAALMQSTLEEMHVDLQNATELTFPLILAQTGTETAALAGKLDAVRQGQQAAVDNNADIFFGAVGYDRSSMHWTSDAEAATYASRFAVAVEAALFGGATGTPPRLVSAVVKGTTVTLTYDRDLEVATNYTANAWAFDDDGSVVALTAATKMGNRIVELTLAIAPISTATILALGSANTASGDDVPLGLGGHPALPELALVTSDAHAPVWEMLSVEQVRRVISIS